MMKLSEAIRLGSMDAPQADGWYYYPPTGGMCAQGAALHAIGRLDRAVSDNNHDYIQAAWPWIKETYTDCPACGVRCDAYRDTSVRNLIPHLNNSPCYGDHGWTRERISDWIATVEPKDEAPAVTAAVEALVCVTR